MSARGASPPVSSVKRHRLVLVAAHQQLPKLVSLLAALYSGSTCQHCQLATTSKGRTAAHIRGGFQRRAWPAYTYPSALRQAGPGRGEQPNGRLGQRNCLAGLPARMPAPKPFKPIDVTATLRCKVAVVGEAPARRAGKLAADQGREWRRLPCRGLTHTMAARAQGMPPWGRRP